MNGYILMCQGRQIKRVGGGRVATPPPPELAVDISMRGD